MRSRSFGIGGFDLPTGSRARDGPSRPGPLALRRAALAPKDTPKNTVALTLSEVDKQREGQKVRKKTTGLPWLHAHSQAGAAGRWRRSQSGAELPLQGGFWRPRRHSDLRRWCMHYSTAGLCSRRAHSSSKQKHRKSSNVVPVGKTNQMGRQLKPEALRRVLALWRQRGS